MTPAREPVATPRSAGAADARVRQDPHLSVAPGRPEFTPELLTGGEFTEFWFTAADGTRLVGWTNGGDGPQVMVCNGLGVPPQAWPRLIDPHCGYQVVSWNHRGGLGSERPADPDAIRVEDHADDALALLDAAGWSDALLVGWSIGVNVSFELATVDPDRVNGLLMVAGVPGDTFEAAFSALMVPKPWRKPLALGVARAGRALGGPINLLTDRIPKGRPFAELLRHSGFMVRNSQVDDIIPWINAFSAHDFGWYFNLGLASAAHEYCDPSQVQCPVTVVAGGFDVLTSMRDVVAFAEQIEHARVEVLQGTHMLPLEFPDHLLALLDDLEHEVRTGG